MSTAIPLPALPLGMLPSMLPSAPSSLPSIMLSFLGGGGHGPEPSPRFRMVLWSIIAGTRGGANRAKILDLIKDTPLNAHRISTQLGLDHKTVAHHIKILAKNGLVKKAEKDYGAEYELSDIMVQNQDTLDDIVRRLQRGRQGEKQC